MHLTILTLGSRGDVQPFAALGLALQKAGFGVRMATHGIFQPMLNDLGLTDFVPVEGNPQAITQGEEGREWLETERNPLAFARGFRQLMGPVIFQAMQDGLHACRDTQALIFGGPAYYVGYSIAEKLGIPCLQGYLQPIHPTGEFPSALFPLPFSGGRLINYLSHTVGGMTFWQLLRPVVNEARRQFLDLPPLSVAGPFLDMEKQQIPTLYGFSPSVVPRPANWKPWHHVTGYWFVENQEWDPPADLLDFLQSGPPPVYVGFGSMAGREPEHMTRVVLQALRRSGQRGLLVTGWGGLTGADLSDDVFVIDSAPHDWLFPRMAALVHHGGAGTTGTGLAAGKPTVIIPFFGDQPFWGERVYKIGAGPRPIARKDFSADTLDQAIRQAVQDPAINRTAAALGEAICRDNGPQEACRIIDRFLQQVIP